MQSDIVQIGKKGVRSTVYQNLYEAAEPIPDSYTDITAETEQFQEKLQSIQYVWSHFDKIRRKVKITNNTWHRVTTQQVQRFIDLNKEFDDNESFLAIQEQHQKYAMILSNLVPMAESLESHQKKFYQQIFKFQDETTKLLGRSIDLIFVWRGDESTNNQLAAVKLSHENINDFLRLNWKNQPSLSFVSDSEMGYTLKMLKEQQKKLPTVTILDNQIQMLYHEIQRRQGIASKKRSDYLFWQVNGEWQKIKFGKWGYIFEALMNMAINNPQSLDSQFPNGNLDEMINYFVIQFLPQVDNAAGFVSEDVKIGDTESYSGIKSTTASLMGVTIIVDFAKQVISVYQEGTLDEATVATIDKIWNGSVWYYKLENIVAANINDAIDKEIISKIQNKE